MRGRDLIAARWESSKAERRGQALLCTSCTARPLPPSPIFDPRLGGSRGLKLQSALVGRTGCGYDAE
jgi:hypothetical protein